MKCPHCCQHFTEEKIRKDFHRPSGGYWYVSFIECPNTDCHGAIFFLERGSSIFMVYPQGVNRGFDLTHIPSHHAENYRESCSVLAISPKASAALSRRCLDAILTEQAGFEEKENLSKKIDAVIKSNMLPPYISRDLDTLREIGNFSAHAKANIHSGEIIDVDPEEAEYCLGILESLFTYYFIQPVKSDEQRDRLNEKLIAAGKNPITPQ